MNEDTQSLSFDYEPEQVQSREAILHKLWKTKLNELAITADPNVRKFNIEGRVQPFYILKKAEFTKPLETQADFMAIDDELNLVALELSVKQTQIGFVSGVQRLPLDLAHAGFNESSFGSFIRAILDGVR